LRKNESRYRYLIQIFPSKLILALQKSKGVPESEARIASHGTYSSPAGGHRLKGGNRNRCGYPEVL